MWGHLPRFPIRIYSVISELSRCHPLDYFFSSGLFNATLIDLLPPNEVLGTRYQVYVKQIVCVSYVCVSVYQRIQDNFFCFHRYEAHCAYVCV